MKNIHLTTKVVNHSKKMELVNSITRDINIWPNQGYKLSQDHKNFNPHYELNSEAHIQIRLKPTKSNAIANLSIKSAYFADDLCLTSSQALHDTSTHYQLDNIYVSIRIANNDMANKLVLSIYDESPPQKIKNIFSMVLSLLTGIVLLYIAVNAIIYF